MTPREGKTGAQGDSPAYAAEVVATVLVVEDDPTVSSVLSAYLRRAGFEPVLAADGLTALQAWRERRATGRAPGRQCTIRA